MTHEQVITELRAIRYTPRLTLTEIARRAGVDRQTIYNALQGRAGAPTLSAIGRVLDEQPRSATYPTHREPR